MLIKLFLFLILTSISYAKVYDCFIFFNELELLEIRFHELYDKVDKFVLVESVETFRGTAKPLYFQENKERFSKFLDKVIHVVVEDRLSVTSPWEREFFQRNQIMRGLEDCSDRDLVILSDVDEIVRADKISALVDAYDQGHRIFGFDQDHYRFYMNMQSAQCWIGSTATTVEILKQHAPQWLRESRRRDGSMKIIPRGGWHFTYLGDEAKNLKKLESFAHSEYDRPDYKTLTAIKKALAGKCRVVKIDASFPKFVVDNLPLMDQWGFILH